MNITYSEEKESSIRFDLKRLLTRLARNYIWFLLMIGLFGAGAWFYLRYTIPLYLVSSYVQIKQPRDAGSLLGSTPFARQNTVAAKDYQDINSEVFRLRSSALIGEVVDSLQLGVQVSTAGRPGERFMPVDADALGLMVKRNGANAGTRNYQLTIHDTGYELTYKNEILKGVFNTPLIVRGDTVVLQHPPASAGTGERNYRVDCFDRSAAVSRYASRLSVNAMPKVGTGILQISLRDEIPLRAKQFIEVLAFRYDLSNFNFKSKSLLSEMEFLDSRLATVNEELEKQENNVRDFKATNKINDVSSSANQLLTSLSTIDSRKTDNEFKERLVNLVEQNIGAMGGNEARINVPGLQDVELANLVGKYNDLVTEKKNILVLGTANDLRLPSVNARLQEARNAITSRIQSIRSELNTSNQFLSNQEKNTTGRFRSLPEKEKDYIQVSRLLNIKQALYVFLLQRKEDLNIEYASSGIGETRFIDWKINNTVQDPKPLFIYTAALAIGLLIPAGIIILRFLLNKKIETSQEIYEATNLPVAGEIAFEKSVSAMLPLSENNVTPVAEQFRTLRTNIMYLNKGTQRKVLMITSCTSGEGKSFISLNFGHTMAITGKKVVLLEFDLRNPSLSNKLGLGNLPGITNFLEGEAPIEEIVHDSGHENLSFIAAGAPLSSRPGEVILSHRMEELFFKLREQFDCIIVDTPPIEMVSDALTLAGFADNALFVVRHKYSNRSALKVVNQLHEQKKLPNVALVINGIIHGDGFHHINGYGYGYNNLRGGRRGKSTGKLKIA